MRNILIALVILFVIAVVAFTFLVPLYVGPGTEPDAEQMPEVAMMQLTEQELEKLGPKNDLKELDWLQSNGMYGMIVHPKRLLESQMVAPGKDLLGQEIMRMFMIPLDMSKVELLISCTSIQQVSLPPQPGESVVPQIMPMPFVSYCIKMSDPIDKMNILNQFVPPNQGIPAPKLRTIEGKEVYDLPAAYPLKTHALIFLDENTFLYVLGSEELLRDVINGKAPTGPLADRMARAKIAEADAIFVVSAESGLPPFPPEMVSNFAKSNNLPETLLKLLLDNFRAVLVNVNMSAPENEQLISVKLETLKPEGAKEIGKILNEQLVFYRSSLNLLQSQNNTPNPPTDEDSPIASLQATGQDLQKIGSQILDSLEIASQDMVVSASMKRFAELSTYVSEFFQDRRDQIAVMEEQARLNQVFEGIFQRISMVRQYMIMYHNEKSQFPATICDAEGNPLLSWRVALLPYMGEKELHSQFKLDEPWDGPTNKPLIGKMPAIFGDARAYDPTRTTVRLFNSEGTPFSKPNLKMTDVLGQQTTIMLVAVLPENAVEWTKPDSLAPCGSMEEYAGLFGPNIPALLFDGKAFILQTAQDSVAEKDHALLLERLKKMIEGQPL